MQPPAPPRFRRGLTDRLMARLRLSQPAMMILRSITRWPGRAAVTLFGVAASVAVLVASYFTFDATDAAIDRAFNQANRQQVTLSLTGPRGLDAVEAARRLPGVLSAEGAYVVPVRLENGNRTQLLALRAGTPDAVLTRSLDDAGLPVAPPPPGLMLPARLAATLGLAAGDPVTVELLAPPRDRLTLPVGQLTTPPVGQEVTMNHAELFARLRLAPQVNQIDLMVDAAALPALHAAVKRAPAIAGVVLWSEARVQFDEAVGETLLTMGLIYTLIGVLITIGVVYNAARIQLAERSYDLASLRVLGFSRAEVSFVLVGETMLLSLAAVPVGWVLGYGFAATMAQGLSNEIVTIPLVIERSTYALAGAVALVAALGSVLLVGRRLHRVDMVIALKQKE
jgi:putative ABC transport system permease protein